MGNNNYKMATVYQYLDLIEPKLVYHNNDNDEIKKAVYRFLTGKRQAAKDAKLLEKILA